MCDIVVGRQGRIEAIAISGHDGTQVETQHRIYRRYPGNRRLMFNKERIAIGNANGGGREIKFSKPRENGKKRVRGV